MKHKLLIIFLLVSNFSYSNMASPVREGTLTSSAFSSHDIDILKENINLTIDKDFKTGLFQIEYIIRSDSDGIKIPLLFHAVDYKGDFKVLVDGIEVQILDIPDMFLSVSDTTINKFNKFSDSFTDTNVKTGRVTIYWEEGNGNVYDLSDLKYFETDLTKGEHVIKVEFTADAWVNVKDWVKEYSFRYSLSPAKNWRSFGSLEITLNSSAAFSNFSTSLGEPDNGDLNLSAKWTFTKVPADFFTISYTPQISSFANTLLDLGPMNLTSIFAFVLILIHVLLIKMSIRKNPSKISWVVIIGSFVIPFLILLFYIYSFDIIDFAIGSEAGKYHGYTFMSIIVYPVFVPVYWILMWLIGKLFKKKIKEAV